MNVIKSRRPAVSPEIDPSTLSNYQNFAVSNTELFLDVLFDEKIVAGTVLYHLEVLNKDVSEVILDTSFLTVESVTVNGSEAEFSLHERVEPLGSRLAISIPPNSQKVQLFISFRTTERCTAIQFLDKEATDGKKAPYLFCQCQAIHARSLFPCFDTPALKSTYKLSAKSPLFTLMSGRPVNQEGDMYYFDQPVPIPSYLISIASGDIVKAKIGPRSDIYSEPVKIKDCQWEFENDMEDFIQIAEKLVFEYEWLRFDSLVLPSSFPYGGMEIPNLCQLTPTLICKDRSQVTVMAHELAHSWSGNLVTNCSWEHFWLNEGWTVYIERRIIEGIATAEAIKAGKKDPFAYGESMRHFSAIIGWNDLENSIKAMGNDAERFSPLVLDLKAGEDPDDSFSTVPYEKGFNLLFLIEQTVGGKKVFDKFIPSYFKKFRYGSLDTYQFVDYLYEFFNDKKVELDSIDWESWLYKPGMPPVMPKFDTTLADECYELADEWFSAIKNNSYLKHDFSSADIKSFEPNQSVVFLDTLISYNKHKDFNWKDHVDALKLMETAYTEYDTSLNAEILFRWYMLQVSGEREEFQHKLGQWLGTVGRMKFVRPGYVLLNEVNRELAIYYFKKFESNYHPICKTMVKKDLGLV
ncbi:Probable leukotriene A-4 hydrolase (LTA-4 hydrolase) (Leukotriene A(4) hydrolase) [Scheffersomyces stipitis CBS 6054]|uniref:Leucine aminopeptidase 2-2 n=1 Tax=Scheffersomyces stipitis (strain ATCC 58785 / CBS 6054 / NBRC 10063 / NRRL Y-11545) TaxID=322104 RepID=LKA42_PICST|nr:Probable leukotriene A-4 hydrolase (LTA-4 hydrolase) (Leukotriene A(4) hydrolase) [Scheffersomyces stipitis CBS 6054]A3LQI7.2 RecName: Full=Leucine aminopeptidase 2-2; AltName: Full=Epoxide hydrolase; AltName: Full=Leukotriene A-4 hydrolase homolog 2; Short=LTA-4 hydrolase 2 [Scheffersomyces stipitis CBS 6054]ABN64689.2 Probable leukotriene A-4 hydrolase (LTA-4 hydrolase) (Leukotriene A(4) hydrolase) [Scheffersomyces stipitis CBS 6054]